MPRRGARVTDEQAEAIATDEDVTLVLAGAGTGKTTVIAAKIAHLVHNEKVDPSQILVLVFNRKARDEIVGRLSGELSKADVRTFHGFGRGGRSWMRGLADSFEDGGGRPCPRLADRRDPSTACSAAMSPSDVAAPLLDVPRRALLLAVRLRDLRRVRGVLQERRACAPSARIWSRASRSLRIANCLTENGVSFVYEATL